jgi:hypothetical protein
MSFREDNKEWFLWTIRDEIYGFIREYLRPIIAMLIVSVAGTIWAFAKDHPMLWLPVGGASFTLAALTVFALRDGRRRRANVQPPQEEKAANKPITLRTLFDSDFPNTHRVGSVLSLKETTTGAKYKVPFRLCVDFEARSQFLIFYVDINILTRQICVLVAQNYKDAIRLSNQMVGVYSMRPSDTAETQLKDVVFSGRIFVYHEYPMNLREMAELEDFYKINGAAVQFRGPTYLALNRKDKRVKLL